MSGFKAIKANKQLVIDEKEIKRFQALGFDIYEGDTVLHYGAGKTVPYGDYAKVKAELDALKAAQKPKPAGK